VYQTRIIAREIDLTSMAVIPLLRAWRRARDEGTAPMPSLMPLLATIDGAILAPAIDSLARLFEAALGRPMRLGRDGILSGDERMLLDALADADRQPTWPRLSGVIGGAVRSTRVMLTMIADRGGRA
jgi:hypothetical protein